MDGIKKAALDKHRKLKGKLSVELKAPIESMDDMSLIYTPGVGAVSSQVHGHPEEARELTGLNNSVAIISDGSAVLGLGNIGPQASLPVMEGKAALFKKFAGIDGYPIVLDVHGAKEIVDAVKAIAPSFGGINLEDIAAPLCFEVEDELKAELDIPVMHDDQHGTAVVVLAGLINALKVTNKNFDDLKVVIVGAGAAGTAIAKLLNIFGGANILVIDSKGIISKSRDDLNPYKNELAEITNQKDESGSMEDALKNADVFIGVSKAGLLTKGLVEAMNKDSIIFAMANPEPEIYPDEAKTAGSAVVATGRSDFPNQVNNALAFPGIFRGALDNQVSKITDDHKLAAAKAIASLIDDPTPDRIIPDIFDDRIVDTVKAVII